MGKLVRDRIPELIRESGRVPITRELNDEEYTRELSKKLKEEVKEFIEANSKEELADVIEVIFAIIANNGWMLSDVLDVGVNKAKSNGKFKDRIYLKRIKNI